MECSLDEFYGGGVVDEVTLVGLAGVCLYVFGAARGAAWGGWPGRNIVHSSPKEQFEVVGECSYANESDTDPGT